MSETSTVRAIAFKAGFEPTNVDTNTYIFTADVASQSFQATVAAGFPNTWNGTSPDYGVDTDVVGPKKFTNRGVGGGRQMSQKRAKIDQQRSRVERGLVGGVSNRA